MVLIDAMEQAVTITIDKRAIEKGVQCLELALHSGTSDAEALAAINGWRRMSGGMPLTTACEEVLYPNQTGADLLDYQMNWKAKFDAIRRENSELRRALKAAERRADREMLSSDFRALEQRAETAERQVADLTEQLQAALEQLRITQDCAEELQIVRDELENARKRTEKAERAANQRPRPAHGSSYRRRWTEAERDFLIDQFEVNRVTPYKALAEICNARFDREITRSAIAGMIYRLRRKGQLPPTRQQSVRALVTSHTSVWETNSVIERNLGAAPGLRVAA